MKAGTGTTISATRSRIAPGSAKLFASGPSLAGDIVSGAIAGGAIVRGVTGRPEGAEAHGPLLLERHEHPVPL